MSTSYITIQNSHNHYEDFVNFMSATTDALKSDSKSRSQYYLSRVGEKFETDVLNAMRSKAADYRFDPELIKKTPRQHFPDIVSNNYYGVEVKTTEKNSWHSTGSSIVENLREEEVKKVFMLFGILNRNRIDFRCKPYEECLSEIAVTHSPRYHINMDMQDGDSNIFSKMGVSYDEFRLLGDSQIDVVKNYYREKYRNENRSMPWWIGDEYDDAIPSVLGDCNEIRFLSDVWKDSETKEYLYTRLYLLFPEVLGNKRATKYSKATLWLCSRYSLICGSVRDKFTAGGKGNIYVNGLLTWENVPKCVCNFLKNINLIFETFEYDSSIESEISMYASYYRPGKNLFELWKEEVNRYIKQTMGANCIDINDLLSCRFKEVKGNDFFLEEDID